MKVILCRLALFACKFSNTDRLPVHIKEKKEVAKWLLEIMKKKRSM